MGYEGPYSLIARCGAEFMGTFVAIYLGEAILANEILPGTKGHELGFGWVAFGFATAFFLGIQFFGFISAHLNPAMCLALAIVGDISWSDWLALSVAEFMGAFFGAVFVWIHYLPHFKTVPKPSPDEDDRLLRSGDPIGDTALHLASYNPRPRPHGGTGFKGAWMDIRYYFGETRYENEVVELLGAGYHTHVDEQPSPQPPSSNHPKSAPKIRRRSVQVADLQRKLKQVDLQKRLKLSKMSETLSYRENRERVQPPIQSVIDRTAEGTAELLSAMDDQLTLMSANQQSQQDSAKEERASCDRCKDEVELQRDRLDELYRLSVIADQNAKLSIFATRPAIYSPIFNSVVEFLGTFMLVLGALMLDQRSTHFCYILRDLYTNAIKAFFIGLMIMCMILGLGGPTGFAANPARDFGPRLAHFLLPIRGKGSSEFNYAWIPFFATLAGGAIAGCIYLALREMNQSETTISYCAEQVDFGSD
eukprot:TRINITY_DN14671_c0_g1_i12.p1 TRINITY_DN14671_c0_g1~~TRINITY_DN14671_c0_g1_i12.p1  ORF type:complete len:477 (-),score=44.35 TRINITY_DN14671_c0_g1_i12:671-2101(-)